MAFFPKTALVSALLTCSLLSACGKKGPLIPPEALAPAPVRDLDVAQKNGYFEVSWSAPSKQEGGARLTDLAGFVLLRRPVLPPDIDCEQCGNAYSELKRIDLEYLQGVSREGSRFFMQDRYLTQGQTYQYKIRSFNTEGVESPDSNKVRRTALSSPLPPVVEALASGGGIVLVFVATPPKGGGVTGYNIYRRKSGSDTPFSLINSKPVSANMYRDQLVLTGTRYQYTVTSVASLQGETVESAPSNQVEATLTEPD